MLYVIFNNEECNKNLNNSYKNYLYQVISIALFFRYLSSLKSYAVIIIALAYQDKKTAQGRRLCSVGAPGVEPGTSCTPCKRASRAAPRPDFRTAEIIVAFTVIYKDINLV